MRRHCISISDTWNSFQYKYKAWLFEIWFKGWDLCSYIHSVCKTTSSQPSCGNMLFETIKRSATSLHSGWDKVVSQHDSYENPLVTHWYSLPNPRHFTGKKINREKKSARRGLQGPNCNGLCQYNVLWIARLLWQIIIIIIMIIVITLIIMMLCFIILSTSQLRPAILGYETVLFN